jgi:hypothetical protein
VEMNVDIKVVLEIVGLLIAVSTGLALGLNNLKRWLRKQVAEPIHEAKQQLHPNGGSQETTRHLIESTLTGVDDIKDKLDGVASATDRHEVLIQKLENRIDRHLLMDHHIDPQTIQGESHDRS